MANTSYNINLAGTKYDWANGLLNLSLISYNGQPVTNLVEVNQSGVPSLVNWTVELTNGGSQYCFAFTGCGGSNPVVTITPAGSSNPVQSAFVASQVNGVYTITISNSAYSWANSSNFNILAKYKGNGNVVALTLNSLGQPVSLTVALSHAGGNYTFVFTGGPTYGTVDIVTPSITEGQDSDTWDASVVPAPLP